MPKQHYQPESFHLADSVGFLHKRAQRLMQERIESLFAEQGCTLQQWAVLMSVHDGSAITVADLCRDLNHDSGAMTRLIDQLQARKLIERRRNSQDRRVVELKLTKAGGALLDKLIPIACDMLNTMLDGFSREEVKLLQSMLLRLIYRLQNLAQAEPVAPPSTAKEKRS